MRPAPSKSSLTTSGDAASRRCCLWSATSCPIESPFEKLANQLLLSFEPPSTTIAPEPPDCLPDPRFLPERSLLENPPGQNRRSVGSCGAVKALPCLRSAGKTPHDRQSPGPVESSTPAPPIAGFGAVGVGRRSRPSRKAQVSGNVHLLLDHCRAMSTTRSLNRSYD